LDWGNVELVGKNDGGTDSSVSFRNQVDFSIPAFQTENTECWLSFLPLDFHIAKLGLRF
jgi:hypothetical protein